MKKILLFIAVLPFAAFAQDGTLVDPTNSQTRQASAALEVYSTNQGFLAPRVALASTADAATVTGTEPNGLLVYNTATAGDVTPGFYYWTGSAWSRLLNGATNLSGSGTTNYLARWTPNGNTLGIGVTYDNGTNVGIGTTSPAQKLHVDGGDIQLNDVTNVAGYRIKSYSTGSSLWLLSGNASNSSLVISTNAHDWDRQVALTYTPGTTGSAAGNLQIGQLNKNNANWTHGITQFYTNGTERMRIIADGNIGINSATPGAKLDVNGGNVRITSTGDAKFEFFGSSSDRGFVGWQATAPAGVYLWNRDNSPIYFGTTNAERVRIDLSGNVGINQTSPTVKLQVGGEIMRTNTRVNSNQRYPVAHATQGDDMLGIDPTWTNAELQAYFNSTNVQWSADATAPSGYAIQITGPVNVGGDYNSGVPYIPIENGAAYYMECWIRSSAANVGHYMGSIEYNENFAGGSGNPGSYGYWVMSNTLPGTSWVKVSGTITGFGSSVGQFQNGKKYWTPQALFNYTNGGGATTYISGWKVVKIASGMTTPSLTTNYIQNQITSAQTSANYWISGTGRAAAFQLNNANTSLTEGSGDALRMSTPTGYIDLGSQNASWAHIQTDRPRYYFNVGGTFDSGLIGSYDEDLSLQTSGTTRITALNSNGNVGINATAPSARFHVAGGGQILGTNGTSSNTRTLTILEDGDAQINFGSYPGAWTSALQIQNNDNTDFVWISPLQDGTNARFMTAGSGLDIFTNGSSGSGGTFAARFENNGSVGLLNLGVVSGVGSASDPSVDQGNNWITWGYRSDNNPYYCIRTNYKTYGSYTYSRLQLNWHTGIEIGAEKTYGGTRFFNNSPGVGATQIMSIGDGDDHVRVNNYLFAAYLNSTDNSVASGVTGVMVKAGDNYFRTGTAAAVASFLGTSLAGNYIQNQYSAAQSANFYISGEAKIGGWFRNIGTTGLYNESYGNHFYGIDANYWFSRSNRGIIIGNVGGTYRGYLYHNDAGSFGLLSQDGNWKVRVDNGAIELYNTTYSPFIYDRDNTGYYLDPNSTTYVNNLRFNVSDCINGTCPSNNAIRMTPNFHLNSGNGYAVILNWDNGSSGATQVLRTTGDNFYVYADGQTFTNNWFRPTGASGLYFQSYGGGWHMTDGTWIRSYGSKYIYCDQYFRAEQGIWSGNGDVIYKQTQTGQYQQASGFGFALQGVLIENNYSESGGFQANGDNANIWSPGDQDLVRFYDEDGMVLRTVFNGSGTYSNPSDVNKKQNIVQVTGALDKLMAINGYNYEFKLRPEEIEKGNVPEKTAGVLAQEVEKVIPEIITNHGEDGKFINYDGLTPYIIEGIKEQQAEIEKIKSANDFGSVQVTSKEVWVDFNDDFINNISSNTLPVVTLSSNQPDVNMYIAQKSARGFKIKITSELPDDLIIDYIAMVHKNNSQSIVPKTQEYYDELGKMPGSYKWDDAKFKAEWAVKKVELAEKQKKLDEQNKIPATPEGYIGPDKTPVHDPKLNDADALIKEYNEKLKQQEGGSAPATTTQINEKAAEDLKNYKHIPADAPMKEAPPAEMNQQNSPR